MLLYLGPMNQEIELYFKKVGIHFIRTEKPITLDFCKHYKIQYILSFGYRYLITEDILLEYEGRTFNIHISFLPYNRGADPNLWSFIEDTPKGVSIHAMTKIIDYGDIYVQRKIEYLHSGMTFKESYNILIYEAQKLLIKHLDELLKGEITPFKQQGKGSFHYSCDKEEYKNCLLKGWNTKIEDFLSCIDKNRRAANESN